VRKQDAGVDDRAIAQLLDDIGQSGWAVLI
jgi:hypothetical protein